MNTKLLADPQVVIVGAGIAGSALAYVLAKAGLRILLLEKSLEHKDVVRGEWMAPWGVAEANRLGLTQIYESEGAHRPTRHINYSEFESAQQSEAEASDMTLLTDDLPLCLGHPTACNLLNRHAVAQGVTYCRGISQLQVTPGSPPTISFRWEGETHEFNPGLVVGADGRNGVVAKQIGCRLHRDPEHHLFSGMLVEEAHDWPEDLQVIATQGDAHVLAFPQGAGKVRIYLGWPKEDRARLVGPDGPANFLKSWQLDCIPHAPAIFNASPASPCIAYPNSDAWHDTPVKEGVVLIGDAAGRNDPILGQGLSISHRDVRLVSDALLNESAWRMGMFDAYVAERRERMARLRIATRFASLKDAAFGPKGYELRKQIHERLAREPELGAATSAAFRGPDAVPAEAFSEAVTTKAIGHPIWSELP